METVDNRGTEPLNHVEKGSEFGLKDAKKVDGILLEPGAAFFQRLFYSY